MMYSAIKEIVDTRGIAEQSRQFMEEASELTVALSHYLRGRVQHKDYILEEVADVEIMLEQLKYGYGLNQEEIDFIKQRKVQRELGRIRTDAQTEK